MLASGHQLLRSVWGKVTSSCQVGVLRISSSSSSSSLLASLSVSFHPVVTGGPENSSKQHPVHPRGIQLKPVVPGFLTWSKLGEQFGKKLSVLFQCRFPSNSWTELSKITIGLGWVYLCIHAFSRQYLEHKHERYNLKCQPVSKFFLLFSCLLSQFWMPSVRTEWSLVSLTILEDYQAGQTQFNFCLIIHLWMVQSMKPQEGNQCWFFPNQKSKFVSPWKHTNFRPLKVWY
jgi:hypothetical protein